MAYRRSNGPDPIREELKRRAVELRSEGQTLRAIGKALGVSHEQARKLIYEALSDHVAPSVATLREVQDQELDQLADEVRSILLNERGPATITERIAAIRTAVGIMDRRAKLHGLDAPTRIEAVGTDPGLPQELTEELTVIEQDNQEAQRAIEAGGAA